MSKKVEKLEFSYLNVIILRQYRASLTTKESLVLYEYITGGITMLDAQKLLKLNKKQFLKVLYYRKPIIKRELMERGFDFGD